MAAIEKVCECSSESCSYYGGDMYKFKHNHLQINPECRSKYFGAKAQVFYLNELHLGRDYYDAYSRWGTSYHKLNKIDDVVYDGVLYNEERYKLIKTPYQYYQLTPIRKVFKQVVMVIVGDEVFYNDVWDMRKFKLNMNKLFGYGNVSYKRVNKGYCRKFQYSHDLFSTIEGGVLTNNKGFDKMVNYVCSSI